MCDASLHSLADFVCGGSYESSCDPPMAVGSWLLVSACGGNPNACGRFRVVVVLSFMSLLMVPFMLMLDKDTPASMTFGGDV
jgi:hypothetical protein